VPVRAQVRGRVQVPARGLVRAQAQVPARELALALERALEQVPGPGPVLVPVKHRHHRLHIH
jgi:hypothetical protein